jgi:hypothetical protein
MSDFTRVAATENPVYTGSFRPGFYDGEQFSALGLMFEDLVENAEWFRSLADFFKSLDEARSVISNRTRAPIFHLVLRTEGIKFGDSCYLYRRIPKEWPAHSLLRRLLLAAPTTEDT